MFNSNGGYSLADIATATGNERDSWGEGGAWWIIILFLFMFNLLIHKTLTPQTMCLL